VSRRRNLGPPPPAARIETSAGGVIFRRGDAGPHVLLIRDAYAHWGLPKGHLEEGETPDVAALREVREETGLSALVLGPLLRTIDWRFRSGATLVHKFCHFYLIECPAGEAVPQLEEGITECSWLPLDAAVERISYRNAREVLHAAAGMLVPATGSEPAS
jgi:8-oxo-dGTP pyrophosphatase MutT (NUDIX family)